METQLLHTGAHKWWVEVAYLAAFLTVWEVAVSGEASRSEGLPCVRMLWSLQGDKAQLGYKDADALTADHLL